MKRLYIDIDGVLLGQENGEVVLARHAAEFIDFVLAHFDCYWLTTHCHGDVQLVLDYLQPYTPAALLSRMAAIKPTTFNVLKTEALEGDFYWLDDSPLALEMEDLKRRGLSDRWIEIDTRKRPDDLLYAMGELGRVVGG